MSIVNKNKLKGIKEKYSHDVAAKKPEQVFGFKPCGVSWDALIKDNLIIHYISLTNCCDKQTAITNCLIGKLSHNCNCK